MSKRLTTQALLIFASLLISSVTAASQQAAEAGKPKQMCG